MEEVMVKDLNHADHIAVERNCSELTPLLCPLLRDGKYFHHGIFDKRNKQVIEFHGETKNKDNARVQRRHISDFVDGGCLYRVVHENCLPVEDTFLLANEVLEGSWPRYDLIKNNCETFATYLKTGLIRHSEQASWAVFNAWMIVSFVVVGVLFVLCKRC